MFLVCEVTKDTGIRRREREACTREWKSYVVLMSETTTCTASLFDFSAFTFSFPSLPLFFFSSFYIRMLRSKQTNKRKQNKASNPKF